DGGTGNDTIYAGRGHDTASGGKGQDTIFATSGGVTTIDGGDGIDKATLGTGNATVDLTFNVASTSTITTLIGEGTTVVNVEQFDIRGGSGSDHFTTADGNDVLTGGGGDDVLDGGAGNDTVVFNTSFGVTADLSTGQATGEGNDT